MANVISVNALNKYVRSILESDSILTDVAIKGEISGFVHHQKSGHFYFQLKDDLSSVKAVMFRQNVQKLGFIPENGMSVIVRCTVSLYERDGTFQIYVEDLFPDGVGAAQLAFEQLKEKLFHEGLFDEKKKRKLPAYPQKIGLVTSKHGAALQDIINISNRRYPLVEYVLFPVNVQGANAEKDIVRAIDTLGKRQDLDVIIVARGGGSKEDLWVFNSEKIARAATGSNVPIVSAIGHEIDYTILDFIADMRVPTPSAAAEVVLPDRAELYETMNVWGEFIYQFINDKLVNAKTTMLDIVESPSLKDYQCLPHLKREEFSNRIEALITQMKQNLKNKQKVIASTAILAESLDPEQVFKRGFAAVMKNHIYQKSASDLSKGEHIDVVLHKSVLHCEVLEIEKRE